MRGVLYRTDEDGNPLATPELKVSAINGSNIKVYANQEAKNSALENGDIKPGDVVLSGGTGKEAPIVMDWENATLLSRNALSPFTTNQEICNVIVPKSGVLYIYTNIIKTSNEPMLIDQYVNNFNTATFVYHTNTNAECQSDVCVVNKGDNFVIKCTEGAGRTYIVDVKLVPYKEI